MNDVLNDLLAEAHALHSRPRAIAAHVVGELTRLEGSGEPWVAELLDEFTVTGAMKRCADFRRAEDRKQVRTKRGTVVEVPAWASTRVREDDGAVVYGQLRFDELDREQVEAYVDRLSRTRDSLSHDIVAAKAVLAYMEEHPECVLAGEAIEALGLAA